MPERVPVPDAPPPPAGWPGPHGDLRPSGGHHPAPPARAEVGLRLAVTAIAVYLLGQLAVGLLAGGLLAGAGVTDPGGVDPAVLLGAAVAGQVAGLAAAVALLRLRRVPLAAVVGPVRPAGRRIATGLALGAATLVGASLLVAVLVRLTGRDGLPEQLILDEALAGGLRTALAVLAAVVLAPIAEELLFRGLLYRALRRRRGVVGAALASSLVFSVVHLDVAVTQPLALVGLVLVGCVLALALERTGGLLVPIAAHAAYNATALAAAIAAERTGLLDLVAVLPTVLPAVLPAVLS